MTRVRGALALASLEQYAGLAVNFALIATLSRLLSPAEIGAAAIATGISTIVFSFREFATAEFLIQRPRIDEHDTRTAFTIFLLASAALALPLVLAAPAIARIYGHGDIAIFLTLNALGILVEAVSYPVISLLRREMTFGRIAFIRCGGALLTAIVSVGLALSGFGFLSIAIGGLCGACLTSALALLAKPKAPMFRPSLVSWRFVFEFGRYRGAAAAVDRIYESLPQLVLGRVLSMQAVGIYNRANMVCGIPDRILLSSVFSIAYPALAAALRQGHDIKAAYLKALCHITAVYWPALVLLAILADPVVRIVLGPNWTAVVPLVQLLSLAAVFWFPAILTYPVLAAMGANRDAFLSNLVGRSVAAVSLCSASTFGLMAMALSQFVNMPFQMAVALIFVRKHVHFGWRELAAALAPSLVVTMTSVAGPVTLAAARGFSLDQTIGSTIATVILGCAGWIGGLALTRHPMLAEAGRLQKAVAGALRRVLGRAQVAKPVRPGIS